MFSTNNIRQVFEVCSGGAFRNEYWHNLICGHIISTHPWHTHCGPNCAGNGAKPSSMPFQCPACGYAAGRWCKMYTVGSETRQEPEASLDSDTISGTEHESSYDESSDSESTDSGEFGHSESVDSGEDGDDDDSDSESMDYAMDIDDQVHPGQIWNTIETSANDADDRANAMDTNSDLDMEDARSNGSSARWSTSTNSRRSPPPVLPPVVWDSSDDERPFSPVPSPPSHSPEPQPIEYRRIADNSKRQFYFSPNGRRQPRLEEEMRRMSIHPIPYRPERINNRLSVNASPRRKIIGRNQGPRTMSLSQRGGSRGFRGSARRAQSGNTGSSD